VEDGEVTDLFGAEVRDVRKNFSRNNVGQRRAGDFYQTPMSMTRQFLDTLPIEDLPVLEPAEGKKAITNVLKEYYLWDVTGYDIAAGDDFLQETRKFPTIITNPPFSLSTEFILKCKEVATHRFSLLMPIDYLHGQNRFRRIFSVDDDWKLSWLHVYTWRAMMDGNVRDDGKYQTGMITWAWYTWLRFGDCFNGPCIRWIDNDAFVIRKE
jgi:hypothetical protein